MARKIPPALIAATLWAACLFCVADANGEAVTWSLELAFDIDRPVADQIDAEKLTRALDLIRSRELEIVIATGHARVDGEDRNATLRSVECARLVKDIFVARGVDGTKITAVAGTASRFIPAWKLSSEEESSAQKKSCRVEVEVVDRRKTNS